jgi:hypothetical protein
VGGQGGVYGLVSPASAALNVHCSVYVLEARVSCVAESAPQNARQSDSDMWAA